VWFYLINTKQWNISASCFSRCLAGSRDIFCSNYCSSHVLNHSQQIDVGIWNWPWSSRQILIYSTCRLESFRVVGHGFFKTFKCKRYVKQGKNSKNILKRRCHLRSLYHFGLDEWNVIVKHCYNDNDRGKQKQLKKTCIIVAVSMCSC